MEKTILISDKEVKIRTSAALPRLYRIKFGRDIFKDLLGLKNEIQSGEETLPTEALEIFENIAYIMAAHADPSVSGNVSEWLEQFETLFNENRLEGVLIDPQTVLEETTNESACSL